MRLAFSRCPRMSVNPKLKFVIGSAAFFVALWFLWDTAVLYPLKVFVVFLHEVSHALATVATGGSVERIELYEALGGAAYSWGGSSFLILSAGYLGSLLWGVLLCRLAGWRRLRPGLTIGILGVTVLVVTVALVRTEFGWIFGALFGVGLIVIGRFAPPLISRGVLLSLGMVSVLYAILDIKSDILDRPEAQSDAYFLAEMTGVPALAWGVVWIAIAGFVAWRELRRAYRLAGEAA